MRRVTTLADLRPLVGSVVGSSPWVEVDQQRIDLFAEATGDHQWIHVDPERARSGPFGATIAHGYLTLSMLLPLWSELLEVDSVTTKVNCGLNKVRFPAPLAVGSRIRATVTLRALEDVVGGAQLTIDGVIEREGGDKPVCVAEAVLRFYE